MNQTYHTEDLGQGIARVRLTDEPLVIFSIENTHRSSVDTWVNAVKQTLDSFPPGASCYMLHVVSPRGALTPYARERAMEVLYHRVDMKACVGVVVANNLMGHVIKIFAENQRPANLETRVFFSQDDGLAWLRQRIARHTDHP